MTIPATYSFIRYLTSKKSVDDRALNQSVLSALRDGIPVGSADRPLQILEVGAGIGTMLERFLAWELFENADYTAVDVEPENIAEMSERLPRWIQQNGGQVDHMPGNQLKVKLGNAQAVVEPVKTDLYDFVDHHDGTRMWDLLVAHAFLDLVDLSQALPRLFRLLKPGGWFYFTINFDGATIFQPDLEPALDERIIRLYHHTMDERLAQGKPSGESRAGRHLFTSIRRSGGQVLAAGSSDWVVFAAASGYPQDEAYFLHFILHTIAAALQSHPDLQPDDLQRWIGSRQAQVESGELIYIAHQLDFFGQVTY